MSYNIKIYKIQIKPEICIRTNKVNLYSEDKKFYYKY